MRGVSFLIGGIVLSCGSAFADTYWVSPNGAATWSNGRGNTPLGGTSACALSTANRNAKAGDTVVLRGGTYVEQQISPAHSGTSDSNRIIYTSHDGEQPLIRGLLHGILVQEKSYITVNGVKFKNLERWGHIETSHHITISHCDFDGRHPNSGRFVGLIVTGTDEEASTHNWIHHCTFYRWAYGDFDALKGGLVDIGSTVTGGATHNLIESNTFAYGGHHTIRVGAPYNVIRNNYIHNETNAANWNHIGYRGASTVGAKAGRSLWERNRFGFSRKSGLALRSRDNIIRRNQFYRQGDGAIQVVAANDGVENASNNRIYHNSFYRNGHSASFSGHSCGLYLARWSDGEIPIVGNVIKNNIFFGNKNGQVCKDGMGLGAQVIKNNWDNNRDPGFVEPSGTDPDDPDSPNLRLKNNSPARDQGAFLTDITSPSGSGVSFQVADSRYFMDGWGVIAGDRIQLEGQTKRVRITHVDYQSHVVTFDESLTFTRGQGVSLAYSDGAPDLGAFEITDAPSGPPVAPPAAPSNLRVVGQPQ